jgi:hypothetical protein
LAVSLYGCETWFAVLREECGLNLLDNRVLRKIFGPKRDEVIRECIKLHKAEFHDTYSTPNIIDLVK